MWNHLHLKRRKQRYQDAQQTLIDSDSLLALPTLLSILKAEPDNIGVTGALTRLLPRLQTSYAGSLDGEQRDFLHERLRPPYTPDLALEHAILQGLEQIGSVHTRLFLDRRLQKLDMPVPLMQTMQHCREVLYEREIAAQRATTLLRASAMPATPDAQLLRPTQATMPAPPEQLLRAAADKDVQT